MIMSFRTWKLALKMHPWQRLSSLTLISWKRVMGSLMGVIRLWLSLTLVLLVLVWLVLIHLVPFTQCAFVEFPLVKQISWAGWYHQVFPGSHSHSVILYAKWNHLICELASKSFVMIITLFIPIARVHKIKLDPSKKLNCVWFLKTFKEQTDCSRSIVVEVGGSLHCVQEVQYPHSPSIVLDFLWTFQVADLVTKSVVSQFLAALCGWSYSFSEKYRRNLCIRWIDHLHNDMFKMQLTFTGT